jgi:hypothetical protein
MCMFSGDVKAVSDTQIFARQASSSSQFLVYAMNYDADSELAMILPLPTPVSAPEDSVQFIDLSKYSDFFKDMSDGFSPPMTMGRGIVPWAEKSLQVHQVGSFEASFVPKQADFGRLDPRFRLSNDIWASLPQYRDSGFAVFKLKPDAKTVHPMAFEFPQRDPGKLFFPTVHIHQGKVRAKANFDHELYCQTEQKHDHWEESSYYQLNASSPYEEGIWEIQLAKSFIDIQATKGIVNPDLPIQKRTLSGWFDNCDVIFA